MSYQQFQQQCVSCAKTWNAAFGVVGKTQIATPPTQCPYCGSKELMKIAPSAEQAPAGQADVVLLHHTPTTPTEVLHQQTVDELRSQLEQAEELRKAQIATINESGSFLERIVTEHRKELSTAREMLTEKQDEADALRKALEHETQSHLDTCERESTTREIARELVAELHKVLRLPEWQIVGIKAQRVLAKARAAGLLDAQRPAEDQSA